MMRTVVVMGVSGCGKTTVGKSLAERLGWDFIDADDYHPTFNVEKMRRGEALTDQDREGWLLALVSLLQEYQNAGRPVILACSALRETYRKRLRINKQVDFVYLQGTFETIKQRLEKRQGHFMNPGLLKNQFQTLEEPQDALAVDIAKNISEQVDEIVANLFH